MRTIIDLPDEQVSALQRLGEHTRLSRAELVRRAVTEYLGKYHIEEMNCAFGLWQARGGDGLEYEDILRGEWRA